MNSATAGSQRVYHLAAYVGAPESRKNPPRLRTWSERWRQATVGVRNSKTSPILESVQRLELEPYVTFTGYVPAEPLPALYAVADLFAFPSFYERFGFPVREAMACGTPVVCSYAASLPEVVGHAAINFDPPTSAP
jgi:glycosyltransferase involved in cell wall biosynthesis